MALVNPQDMKHSLQYSCNRDHEGDPAILQHFT